MLQYVAQNTCLVSCPLFQKPLNIVQKVAGAATGYRIRCEAATTSRVPWVAYAALPEVRCM